MTIRDGATSLLVTAATPLFDRPDRRSIATSKSKFDQLGNVFLDVGRHPAPPDARTSQTPDPLIVLQG